MKICFGAKEGVCQSYSVVLNEKAVRQSIWQSTVGRPRAECFVSVFALMREEKLGALGGRRDAASGHELRL